MTAIDDFKAEYARQHPHRPEKGLWSDEALVIAKILDRHAGQIAELRRGQDKTRRSLFLVKHRDCDE